MLEWTERKQAFTFGELSEEAKATACENEVQSEYGISNLDYNCFSQECITEMESELSEKGFMGAKIEYSGFWSQGDGACFTCKKVDLPKVLDIKEFCNNNNIRYSVVKAILPYLECEIKKEDYHYSHEYTVGAYIHEYEPYYKRIDAYLYEKEVILKLEKAVDAVQQTISRKFYRELENLYERCYSVEYIREFYTEYEGEFYFTVDGELIGDADTIKEMAGDNVC